MSRITTAKKINEAISNELLQVAKAEVYYKTSRKTETMDADRFQENLDFLCESGCFADAIGWHYELNHKTNNYEIETGRKNPDSEIIITAHLNVAKNATEKDIEQALLFLED